MPQHVIEYLQKAQECVSNAQRATDPDHKATWLKMAEGWQTMAEAAAARLGPVIQVSPDRLANPEPTVVWQPFPVPHIRDALRRNQQRRTPSSKRLRPSDVLEWPQILGRAQQP